MSEFIAKIGYTLMWGFGTPAYSLDEAFDRYYTIGLILFILGIVGIGILPILIILLKRMERDAE